MALKFRNKVLLAKIEATYGADAAPTGAANAIAVRNLTLTPMEGQTVSRDLVRPTLGNFTQIHVGTHVLAEFEVEVAGSGAAGTAPAYGPLLRGCAMAETVTAGSSVAYDPVSSNEESVTLYFNLDGNLHKLTGARGTLSMQLDPQGLPYFTFRFTGLWNAPGSAALPAADFSAFQTPLPVSQANTPTFTLHGGAVKVGGWQFDQNNTVAYDNLIGEEVVDVTDRQPSGQVTIEAPANSSKNWFTTAEANTLGALQWVHGAAAGQIVQFDAPRVQVLQPQYQERNGKAMLQMGLSFVPNAGDDEFTITVK